jgi:predicted DNA-binding transcriptional regulator AlpA
MNEESTRLMRLQEVLRIIPVSKASWYNGMKSGRYPRPVQLSVRTVAWKLEDIDALLARLIPGNQHEAADQSND